MISLILYNIRSTHNVGSIFRTADAAGVGKIYLCGFTPAPEDRFGRKRHDIAKVSLGAEKSLEWELCEDVFELIGRLEEENVQIMALEQSPRSVSYKDIKVDKPTALILGSEVEGVPQAVLDRSHIVAEIPMLGGKESLNVSVAVGIALYRMLDI
jgi:tRNA G18 (ribose-2'-O)-methylase SpoU